MQYFIFLLIIFINSNSFAHFSLKQHEIIHYYPSLEKEYLMNKCSMGSLKRPNCNIDKKESKKKSSKK
ncbi:MAG: hypothetical protein P8J46_05055 [Alphaproteobacteria bacterium]|nr:hypothetical protein [Alphaproteobacteria bacterium]